MASIWLTQCTKPDQLGRSKDQIASAFYGMVAFPNDGRTNRHVIQVRPVLSRRTKFTHHLNRIAPEAGLAINAFSLIIAGQDTNVKPPATSRPGMGLSLRKHGAEGAFATPSLFDKGIANPSFTTVFRGEVRWRFIQREE
jgi:hypothetical protein